MKNKIILVLFIMMTMASVKCFANQAILSWDPNTETDLAGYKIHFGTMSGTYTKIIDVSLTKTPAAPTYTIFGLTPGNTYYFVATAYDATGNESGYSNEVFKTITADAIKPADAIGFTSAAYQTGVRLSWTNPPDTDLVGVVLEYTYNGGALTHINDLRAVPNTPQTYDHLNLVPGQYAYALHTKDSSGNITNTAHADIIIDSAKNIAPTNAVPPAESGANASSDGGGGGGCGMVTQKKESGIDPTFFLIIIVLYYFSTWKLGFQVE